MEAQSFSVLVIDGDSASRHYLADLLGKSGYTALLASLGREGLILAWRDKPDLIILDPVLPDLGGIELVTRLRQDRRTADVPCVALSSRDNAEERVALLAAGCNEYLVKSRQAPQQLSDLLPRLLHNGQTPKKEGKLIVFLSAKGGTGTSSMCANVATCVASANSDKKVAVMDLVLPIGSIAHIVGYEDRLNLVTVAVQRPEVTTPAYFAENLPLASGWSFYLLAGAPDPESANQLSYDRVSDILKALLISYDFVLVDLGRSLSRISMPIIKQAEVVVMVISTDLATAGLTLTVWKYLESQGVKADNVYAIQNRAVGLEGLTKSELEKTIGLPVRLTIPYMGDNLTVANNRHEPILTRFASDSIAMLLKQVAAQVVEVGEQGKR